MIKARIQKAFKWVLQNIKRIKSKSSKRKKETKSDYIMRNVKKYGHVMDEDKYKKNK